MPWLDPCLTRSRNASGDFWCGWVCRCWTVVRARSTITSALSGVVGARFIMTPISGWTALSSPAAAATAGFQRLLRELG
jgi:hypothetical protein